MQYDEPMLTLCGGPFKHDCSEGTVLWSSGCLFVFTLFLAQITLELSELVLPVLELKSEVTQHVGFGSTFFPLSFSLLSIPVDCVG